MPGRLSSSGSPLIGGHSWRVYERETRSRWTLGPLLEDFIIRSFQTFETTETCAEISANRRFHVTVLNIVAELLYPSFSCLVEEPLFTECFG